MTPLDPEGVKFERIGDPNTSLGTTLVLHYKGQLVFESAATLGIRRKFLLRDHGVILKVESTPTSTPDSWVSQAESEWDVWHRLPHNLLRHFQPLRWYQHDVIRAPQPSGRPDAFTDVHWVVQDWCEGRTGCSFLEYKDRLIAVEAAGFTPHDSKPDQLRTRPDGSIVWLDWGHWVCPSAGIPDHRQPLGPS